MSAPLGREIRLMKLYQLTALAAAAAIGIASQANAAVIADWTFETSAPVTAGPFAAESGTLASTSFASASTSGSYSSPTGNGSAKSFSANNWVVGNYFQFTTSTTGLTGVTLSVDQTGSNTGPKDYELQYSVNGGGYTNFQAYTVPVAANGAAISWSASTANPASTVSFDLSSVAALTNDASVAFRLALLDTSPLKTGSTYGTAGTDRVDNVTISATASPEPATLGLIGLGGIGLLRRRRN